MGMFTSETLRSFDDLYLMQLRDLYSAESQIIDALPKMAGAATNAELKRGFQEHLAQTQRQKQRLEQIFQGLGQDPGGHTCVAMKGLVAEGQEVINADADDAVRDAGLIAAAQRVEHYEIAGYGTVRTFAERLGRRDDVRLLEETLNEEKQTDEKLTAVAEQVVNPAAAQA